MIWPFSPLRPHSFDLVVADPPWPFKTYSQKGITKSPEAHYRTMSMDDIAALPMRNLFSETGVLLLWCTFPLIIEQGMVARHWGFEVKTGGVWQRTASGKIRWGTGYVQRSGCEPYLVCTLPGANVSGGKGCLNFIETLDGASCDGLAREHSRKPDEFYEMCERLSPGARRCELFSRVRRSGWHAFGDQIDKFARAL